MSYYNFLLNTQQGYVLPILPRARPSPPPFTIGRLRVSAQRIYLATLPVYGPFFSRLVSLATWEDSNTSLIYCSVSDLLLRDFEYPNFP